jgi:hypothetical protein
MLSGFGRRRHLRIHGFGRGNGGLTDVPIWH